MPTTIERSYGRLSGTKCQANKGLEMEEADKIAGQAIAVSSTRPVRSSIWKCAWSRWKVGFQE